MTFWQALGYFCREAALSLIRSWRISLLAVLTIAVSLFLAGIFLLVSSNLARIVETWQNESKVLVYFEPGVEDLQIRQLRSRIASEPWCLAAELVSSEQARLRFASTFPSLAELLESWGEEPLPASIEVTFDWDRIQRAALEHWARDLAEDPLIAFVDDDQDWLDQLQAVVLILRGMGLVFGSILLATAVFTISSVIRLTAFIYRDEIAVMRLVGATEFFIRGPFYVEGLLQGLLGSALAMLALWSGHASLSADGRSLATSILAGEFLDPGQVAALISLGGLAGLVGAITSLRREDLGREGSS